MNMRKPNGLGPGGSKLWRDITSAYPDLDAVQLVQLTEACRQKDRLDEMDDVIRGKGVLNLLRCRLHELDAMAENPEATVIVKFDGIIEKANSTANQMKQLLAAMRLPDAETNARPQQRGGARGSYAPKTEGTSAAKRAASRWSA